VRFDFAYDGTGLGEAGLGTPVVETVGSAAELKFSGHISRVTVEVRK
jgi:hypothetical protein